jgi:hypothetical protein
MHTEVVMVRHATSVAPTADGPDAFPRTLIVAVRRPFPRTMPMPAITAYASASNLRSPGRAS